MALVRFLSVHQGAANFLTTEVLAFLGPLNPAIKTHLNNVTGCDNLPHRTESALQLLLIGPIDVCLS